MTSSENKKRDLTENEKRFIERLRNESQRFLKENPEKKSISDFAKKIGFNANTVMYWLNGKRIPSLDNVVKISEALGVSVDWLLGLVPENNRTPDEELRLISDRTGLSNKSVKLLETIHKNTNGETPFKYNALTIDAINRVLDDSADSFREEWPLRNLFSEIEEYIRVSENDFFAESSDAPNCYIKTLSFDSSDPDVSEVVLTKELYKQYKLETIRKMINAFIKDESEGK